MKQKECPQISQELIDYLDRIFPDRAPDPAREDAAIVYGGVRVVRHLKAVRKQQEETIYVSTKDQNL